MPNRGFAKLYNSAFTRMKPNLCPFCVHFQRASGRDGAGSDAYDHCLKKQTLISCAHSEKCRCNDYEISGETRLSDQELQGEIESARDHQTYLQSRKKASAK